MSILRVLDAFRQANTQLALVIDEYGSVQGLLTLNDILSAIVGELPTGAVAGIGSRLLTGSYYSQTIDIFAALVAGSVVAIILVSVVGLAGRHLVWPAPVLGPRRHRVSGGAVVDLEVDPPRDGRRAPVQVEATERGALRLRSRHRRPPCDGRSSTSQVRANQGRRPTGCR